MNSVRPSFPQMVLEVFDEDLGLLGYVVIDCVLSGPSIGGVRMRDGLTVGEVADLAREMTLKYAFLNIPCGGAKAGVLCRPFSNDEERQKLFTAFGKNLGPIITKRIYIPGEDMGTNAIDIYHIKKGAGLVIERPSSKGSDSGYFTALTVFICTERLAQSTGLDLSKAKVAIDGFGKVGASVAQLFDNAGARIVGVSTLRGALYRPRGIEIRRLMELKNTSGDDAVNLYPDAADSQKESLLSSDADVFIPCAGPFTITQENVSQLKAKIVVPGANLAATEEAESMMHERGIHYMPPFVSSCGGILLYALQEHGFWGTAVERIMKTGLGDKISRLIQLARKENISVSRKARGIAEMNLVTSEPYARLHGTEKLPVSRKHCLKHSCREELEYHLWKAYKLSFRFRASRLLRPFAIQYMEDKLSKNATPWTEL